MKLYVCWGTMRTPAHVHPCHIAHHALRAAGYEPEVVRSYGWRVLPDRPFNATAGRREVRRLTGATTVPVLVTDSGEVVSESAEIVAWAERNPNRAST